MTDHGLEHDLEELLAETGPAHHQAFIATDGEDPEWATWYAEYLCQRVNAMLEIDLDVPDLAALLTAAEAERTKHFPDAEWPRFYAEYLLERYA